MFEFVNKYANNDAYERILENSIDNNDDIKDVFLDDPEAMAIGGENDPKIAKFIESIPEDDEAEPVTNEDIEKIEEACLYCAEGEPAITDRISSGTYNELNEEIGDMKMTSGIPEVKGDLTNYLNDELYCDESDDKIEDKISSGGYNSLNEEAYELESDAEIDDDLAEDYNELNEEACTESAVGDWFDFKTKHKYSKRDAKVAFADGKKLLKDDKKSNARAKFQEAKKIYETMHADAKKIGDEDFVDYFIDWFWGGLLIVAIDAIAFQGARTRNGTMRGIEMQIKECDKYIEMCK